MWIVIGWLVLSVLAGVIAENKGRSGPGFFFLSILLSPLIGLIAAVAAKPNLKAVEAREVRSGTMKKCPYCAELVKNEATVCRYCGKDIAPASVETATPVLPKASEPRIPPPPMSRSAKITVGLVVAAAIAIGALQYYFRDRTTLVVWVHEGPTVLSITNDTKDAWYWCAIELSGGYRTSVPTLRPRQTVEVSYQDFRNASTSLLAEEGPSAARRSTQIACAGTSARIYRK